MTLMRKNYKEHLSKRHSEENPLDLTPFGQGKISSFFSLGPPTVRRHGRAGLRTSSRKVQKRIIHQLQV
jgi:hypothetical protein